MVAQPETKDRGEPSEMVDSAGCSELVPVRLGTASGTQSNTQSKPEAVRLGRNSSGEGVDEETAESGVEASEPAPSDAADTSPVLGACQEHALVHLKFESTSPAEIPSLNPVTMTDESNLSEASKEVATHTTKNGPKRNAEEAPLLLSLPIDSLHAIASFLTAGDWSAFGQCCYGASRVCREIFRRVRMHGFRCATEVVAAWKLGQCADARELCSLYIDTGVPIYPHSLGHSYHTLVWRMGIEDRETQITHRERSGETERAEPARSAVHRFSVARLETRAREGYSSSLTYLEEKSLFLIEADAEANAGHHLTQTLRRDFMIAPTRLVFRTPHMTGDDPIRLSLERSTTGGVSTPESTEPPRRRFSNSYCESSLTSAKIVVAIHRHLLDQHLLGRASVDDNDGMLQAAPVSMSVDFFHPHFTLRHPLSSRRSNSTSMAPTDFGSSSAAGLLPAWSNQPMPSSVALGLGALVGGNENLVGSDDFGTSNHNMRNHGVDDSDSESEIALQHAQPTADAVFEPLAGEPAFRDGRAPEQPIENSALHGPQSFNVLSSVELEVYSSASFGSKASRDVPEGRELRNHLKTRFGVYQRRLEALIAHGDSVGFEECILDFWDEFLPQTANIHYYDRNTPVPRISGLHKFLTKPCPKAIGIVQCEIERIRLNPKKKRVNMKERFFPKYEYRLFIRHCPTDNSESGAPTRRDTVLMTAKNKGRKHVESSAPPQSKKGANNYYLYMPRQDDVEYHYQQVNGLEKKQIPVSNGTGVASPSFDSVVLLGRLQSNFIGTEFQIFTPQIRKPGNPKTMARSVTTPVGSAVAASDDELGYDSGMSSDNASSSSRRRGPFGRLSLRKNATEQSTIAEGQPVEANRSSRRSLRRSRSSGDVTHARVGRTSRRAIANTAETAEPQRLGLCEEEDGAITYTANLLGSRPRIMDVCIPKVNPVGLAGAEWKKYLDVCTQNEDASNSRMLNHLKQIQSRMENEEQGRLAGHVDNPEAGDESSEDYSPPEDFGLLALQNRPPWWNIELGSFVLNFGGRVSVASVKNFQLCDRSDQDYIMLQFGRIQGRHSFTMDFQHPLTAVQAFAIAISSLQSKISLS